MQGHGGDGVYTYYWQDELRCESTGGSCTFDVRSAGGAIVGRYKVVSGDGQVVEQEFYIPGVDCN